MKKKGIALLMVLISLALLSFFITQLLYTSNIDVTISKKNKNRLQSYYLAQSAARMGLLRVHMFKETENLIASQSALSALVPQNIRSMIWSLALPSFPLSGQKSAAPGTLTSIIKGEGSKIPLNLIDEQLHRMPLFIPKQADAKNVSDSIKKQIQYLLDQRAENDQSFREKLEKYYPNALPNSIADWMDIDDRVIEGGDEDSIYQKKTPPYKPRNDRFGAISELSMIDLWDDDTLRPLKNEFSLINLKAKINCNTLSLERLKAYSKNSLTDADLGLIQKRRLSQPFGSLEECEGFIRSNPDISGGADFQFPADMKTEGYEKESVFVVEGSGSVGDSHSIVRLYVRIEEETPDTKKDPSDGGKKSESSKFGELHVIRFEEGASP
jgi:type II secretory pathway component PulK